MQIINGWHLSAVFYIWWLIIHLVNCWYDISFEASFKIVEESSYCVYSSSIPFKAKKTNITCAPILLFPSINGWLFTNPKHNRDAFVELLDINLHFQIAEKENLWLILINQHPLTHHYHRFLRLVDCAKVIFVVWIKQSFC